MANENGWGDGSVNNAIGWGQGANNAISWGKSHLDSWSGATDIDGGNAPINTVAPALSGTAQEGQTLTCSTGTWSGSPTYAYQWKRNGNNIGSATNSTYTLVTADVGQSIKCTVTATNFSGSANADSNTVVPISAFTGLLDTYPNAAVAYSLRKLRTAYAGSAIRVRRSVDNAEQDIAFVGNDLDTTTMLDFVGYNMWTYSEDISQTTYVKNQLNTTGTPAYVDVETAPDGTLTGDKIIENTVSSTHYLSRATGTILNATDYNFSAYLKQGERTKVRIESQVSNIIQSCILDLTNGTISSNTFANTPVVTAVANGWYRFSITITSGTTSQSNGLTIQLINASNQTTYAGDGTSGCFVWGTQLSQSATVKTYQKTVATAGGNGFVTTWYDQSGNALNSSMSTAANQPRIVNAGVLDVKNSKAGFRFDGSNDYFTRAALSALNSGNTYSIFSVSANETTGVAGDIITTNNSSARLNLFNVTATTGGIYRIAVIQNTLNAVYATNLATPDGTANQRLQSVIVNGFNIAGWKNGVAGSTDTYTGTYTNNRFDIGTYLGVPRYLNGYIQELVIYPSNQTTNRTGIESNINSYYGIY